VKVADLLGRDVEEGGPQPRDRVAFDPAEDGDPIPLHPDVVVAVDPRPGAGRAGDHEDEDGQRHEQHPPGLARSPAAAVGVGRVFGGLGSPLPAVEADPADAGGARRRRVGVRVGRVRAGPGRGRPRDDLLLGRGPGDQRLVVAVVRGGDDVGHDDGDVVRAAALERQLDQPVDGVLRRRQQQRVQDGLLGDHPGQPVGAQQVAVALDGLPDVQVRLDLAAVQRPHQQRPLRMRVRLLGRDPALVDEVLDQRVVVGELDQHVVPEQIAPRVADVQHREFGAGEQHRRDRGAHALERAVVHRHGPQPGVGRADGLGERVEDLVAGDVLVEGGQRRDHGRAGDLSGGVAAHPVGDGQQGRAGVGRVLVALPDVPDVGADGVVKPKAHRWSSRTVFPILTGAPRGTGMGLVTFMRSR
jgi:hypothetical protein